MRSWPMTDWDHDDHEKGAYHEAGHAAVLWTFGVPPTGAVHLEHETHGGCTATELGAATRLSPSTKSLRGSPAGERLAAARNGSACPLCGGGRRWRLSVDAALIFLRARAFFVLAPGRPLSPARTP